MEFAKQEYWSGVPLPSPIGRQYLVYVRKRNMVKVSIYSHELVLKINSCIFQSSMGLKVSFLLYMQNHRNPIKVILKMI